MANISWGGMYPTQPVTSYEAQNMQRTPILGQYQTPPTWINTEPVNNGITLQGVQSNIYGSSPSMSGSTISTPMVSNTNTSIPFAESYLGNGSTVNWGDSATLSNYGIKDWNTSQWQNGTNKSWFGRETPIYNHSGAFESMMQNPAFKSMYGTFSPEKQLFVQQNAARINPANFNTMNTQIDSMIAAQNNSAWTSQNTLGAIQTGVGMLTSLANLYMGYKQSKLAERQLNENLALQRANYRNTAKAMNAQYRDQMSGRGTSVMSGSAKRKLGQMYANRRVEESY